MKNFKAVLSYDGTRYRGWQRQGNTTNTIQGKIEAVLSRLLGAPVEAAGSGRTDAGAHAMGQVVSFRAETELSADEILHGLRTYLPTDIGALSVMDAPPRFHARLSARSKTYCYRIWNSDVPNVFERNYLWHMPAPLDVDAMCEAAIPLLGTHDFAAFCTSHGKKKSTVRTIMALKIERMGEEVRLTVTGDGFLYNMVRILTGTLVEVGLGQREAASVERALVSLDRQRSGSTAPAQGLCLMEVVY